MEHVDSDIKKHTVKSNEGYQELLRGLQHRKSIMNDFGWKPELTHNNGSEQRVSESQEFKLK